MTARHITYRIVDGDVPQKQLSVFSTDEMGPGGAHHDYDGIQHINFQKGPIKENGLNGLTHEVLLLKDLKSALWFMQARTRARLARGVEGTNQQ